MRDLCTKFKILYIINIAYILIKLLLLFLFQKINAFRGDGNVNVHKIIYIIRCTLILKYVTETISFLFVNIGTSLLFHVTLIDCVQFQISKSTFK